MNKMLIHEKKSNRHNIYIYILKYSVIFLLFSIVAFYPFYFKGVSLVNINDGRLQYIPVRYYLHRFIPKLFSRFLSGEYNLSTIDLSIGFGEDPLQVLTYYGFCSPLVFLCSLFSMEQADFVYSVYLIFELYLSGITFSAFCRYFHLPDDHILLGALAYAYCSYIAMDWADFMVFLYMFPLMLLGIKMLVDQGKKYVLMISVIYTGLCGFYFLYGITVLGIIYALILVLCKKNGKKVKLQIVCKGIWTYILAIGLIAPLFLPAVIYFFQSSRFSKQMLENWLVYSPEYYQRLFLNFTASYTTDIGSVFSIIFILAVLYLTISIRKLDEEKIFSYCIFIGFILLTVGNYLFNGFAYTSSRWQFVIGFIFSFYSVFGVGMLRQNDKYYILKTVLIIGFFYSVNVMLVQDTKYYMGIAIFLMSIVTLGSIVLLKKDSRYYKLLSILIMMLISLHVNFDLEEEELLNRVADKKSSYENLREVPSVEIYKEFSSRYTEGRIASMPQSIVLNRGLAFGFPDTTEYLSVINGGLSEFGKILEVAGMKWTHDIDGLDNRTELYALQSVKYLASDIDYGEYIPKGFEYIGKGEYARFYENKLCLPFCTRYYSYFTNDNCNPIELQSKMLKSVFLKKDIDKTVQKDNSKVDNVNQIIFSVVEVNNAELRENCIALGENATITISYEVPKDSEIYLRICGADMGKEYSGTQEINLYSGNGISAVHLLGENNSYYYGQMNYTANLGYYQEEKRDTCVIFFSEPMNLYYDSIMLYAESMENYESCINKLKDNKIKDFYMDFNTISGVSNSDIDSILYFAIPFNKGWKAYLDEEETEILEANIANMAIEVPKGVHSFRLEYETVGLFEGILCCLLSIFALTIQYILHIRSIL